MPRDLEVVWESSRYSRPGFPTTKGQGHKGPLVSQEAKHMKTTEPLTAGYGILTDKKDADGKKTLYLMTVRFLLSINFA